MTELVEELRANATFGGELGTFLIEPELTERILAALSPPTEDEVGRASIAMNESSKINDRIGCSRPEVPIAMCRQMLSAAISAMGRG